MKSFLFCAVLAVAMVQCSMISNRRSNTTKSHNVGEYDGHGGATSYHNVHIEYGPKQKIGSYDHNVLVNHGSGKHHRGHAVVSTKITAHRGKHNISNLSVGGHTKGGYSDERQGNDDYSSGHKLQKQYEDKKYDENSAHNDGDSPSHYYIEGDDGSHFETYTRGDDDENSSEYPEFHPTKF